MSEARFRRTSSDVKRYGPMSDKCQVKCLEKCLAKAKCWSKCPSSIYRNLALILILDRSAKLKKKTILVVQYRELPSSSFYNNVNTNFPKHWRQTSQRTRRETMAWLFGQEITQVFPIYRPVQIFFYLAKLHYLDV